MDRSSQVSQLEWDLGSCVYPQFQLSPIFPDDLSAQEGDDQLMKSMVSVGKAFQQLHV